MANEQWQWQEPLLGRLVIPDNDPVKAVVKLTE